MMLLDLDWENLRRVRDSEFMYLIYRVRTDGRYNLRTGVSSERDTCLGLLLVALHGIPAGKVAVKPLIRFVG